ncbi:hypothetical protein RRG08_061530 [Elysia crispata]|uniref:Uncharacterized protein n=1 Tax=Elysia crispata TaxID=231223 RepID=A0AAE1ARQ6_9GAST|nr:hypothetical protein RRG08_061530 [Elysia crispata]
MRACGGSTGLQAATRQEGPVPRTDQCSAHCYTQRYIHPEIMSLVCLVATQTSAIHSLWLLDAASFITTLHPFDLPL